MVIPKNVVNPFSDKFLETWELWKYWRKNEHDGFQYKGVISEQMALKNLADLSDGDEQKAIRIIEQSIDRGWAGFFPLRTSKKDKDGKSKQSTSKNEQSSSLTERVKQAVNNSNTSRGKSGDSEYMQAV